MRPRDDAMHGGCIASYKRATGETLFCVLTREHPGDHRNGTLRWPRSLAPAG